MPRFPYRNGHFSGKFIATKQEFSAALARLSKKRSASRATGIAFNLILIPGAGALTKDRSDDTG